MIVTMASRPSRLALCQPMLTTYLAVFSSLPLIPLIQYLAVFRLGAKSKGLVWGIPARRSEECSVGCGGLAVKTPKSDWCQVQGPAVRFVFVIIRHEERYLVTRGPGGHITIGRLASFSALGAQKRPICSTNPVSKGVCVCVCLCLCPRPCLLFFSGGQGEFWHSLPNED